MYEKVQQQITHNSFSNGWCFLSSLPAYLYRSILNMQLSPTLKQLLLQKVNSTIERIANQNSHGFVIPEFQTNIEFLTSIPLFSFYGFKADHSKQIIDHCLLRFDALSTILSTEHQGVGYGISSFSFQQFAATSSYEYSLISCKYLHSCLFGPLGQICK